MKTVATIGLDIAKQVFPQARCKKGSSVIW